ncbi:threonine/homoserine efflux transporter RhtA [Albidovulum inexpectatum]|uniref:Threonine/homoserine efflux transporter RhtA n=1 Tax=Albidovulum inexpectatum TaxID=196587 RepID=A0A2S5JLS2_9RHOB|nr:DMT family transporter [Albidovulum inexpectatum]PPB82497.1 threonine/homoserine efflux transporter RhtA [Albidovulum inexpectatum]
MDLRAVVMGLSFALMWSSAFTSARMIVADAPPLAALSLRFLISGLIGVAIARAIGQSWHLTRPQLRGVLIFGLCQNAIYLGLNFVAMQWVEASVAAIIASTMPLLVAVLGWLALGQRLRPLGVGGLVLGFAGVALIMGGRVSGAVDPAGVALCVVAALALAVATLAVRGAASGGNVLMSVGLQMFVGAAILGLASVVTETWQVNWSARLIGAFAYTTLVPGLLATWVWFRLVDRVGAVRAATWHFLNPFFGVLVAAVLLGERLTLTDMIGVAIIAAGILAVQVSRLEPGKASLSARA